MLHLETGVHLEEVEGSVWIHEELDGARVAVTARLGYRQRRLAQGLALRGSYRGGWRLLDQLLVTSLD